jgi:transglutaminase-like putative cysteine protease
MLPASAVIRAGVGFCNPKSTLFVALLRGAGIPARQHMVSINMNVLKVRHGGLGV